MQYINNQSTSSTAAWLYPKIKDVTRHDPHFKGFGIQWNRTMTTRHCIKSLYMLFVLQPLYYLFLLCAIYSRGRCSESRPTSCASNRSMCSLNIMQSLHRVFQKSTRWQRPSVCHPKVMRYIKRQDTTHGPACVMMIADQSQVGWRTTTV